MSALKKAPGSIVDAAPRGGLLPLSFCYPLRSLPVGNRDFKKNVLYLLFCFFFRVDKCENFTAFVYLACSMIGAPWRDRSAEIMCTVAMHVSDSWNVWMSVDLSFEPLKLFAQHFALPFSFISTFIMLSLNMYALYFEGPIKRQTLMSCKCSEWVCELGRI